MKPKGENKPTSVLGLLGVCLLSASIVAGGDVEGKKKEAPPRCRLVAVVITVSDLDGDDAAIFAEKIGKPLEISLIGGKPVIEWVLSALRGAKSVSGIVVTGSEDLKVVVEPLLRKGEPFVVGGRTVTDRLKAAMKHVQADHVLLVPADLVLMRSSDVDAAVSLCGKTGQVELMYLLVRKKALDEVYPWKKRTYVTLKEGVFTGSHVTFIGTELIRRRADILDTVYRLRKSPLRLVKFIGLGNTMRYVFRKLSIDRLKKTVASRLSCDVEYAMTDLVDLATDYSRPEEKPFIEKVLKERTDDERAADKRRQVQEKVTAPAPGGEAPSGEGETCPLQQPCCGDR